ncbi:hypothetical protein AOXY_G16769 [Acipenser oxyrinchus oxyrinchus]|uniref:Uncharacterized protein n=1 Tax=Acipenser oxyrinchus oxyrinchus TaxID=40147 RepID=A0AAD8D6A8_ACIOX|nr:hypothetical protein AOXY_G16769 [Acipenser oxyrinchus oxyrinchus]
MWVRCDFYTGNPIKVEVTAAKNVECIADGSVEIKNLSEFIDENVIILWSAKGVTKRCPAKLLEISDTKMCRLKKRNEMAEKGCDVLVRSPLPEQPSEHQNRKYAKKRWSCLLQKTVQLLSQKTEKPDLPMYIARLEKAIEKLQGFATRACVPASTISVDERPTLSEDVTLESQFQRTN